MKGIVAYDSVYGNTKQVAETIAAQARSEGHEIDLVAIRERPTTPATGDFMFVGSPTRVGRMTKEAKAFVAGLDKEYWKNRPIVMFDTVGPLPKEEEKRKVWMSRIEKSAATRMQRLAAESELKTYPEVLHVAVTGFKGPLAPDGLDIARDFTRKFIQSLR